MDHESAGVGVAVRIGAVWWVAVPEDGGGCTMPAALAYPLWVVSGEGAGRDTGREVREAWRERLRQMIEARRAPCFESVTGWAGSARWEHPQDWAVRSHGWAVLCTRRDAAEMARAAGQRTMVRLERDQACAVPVLNDGYGIEWRVRVLRAGG